MVSKKTSRSYGLSNPLQDVFPEPVKAQRAPTTRDLGFEIGQVWVDQVSGQIYALASVSNGSAVWSILSAGTSQVDTLTGDTGGAISPAAGNINILGGDLATVDGAGSTLTINPTLGGYPITPFVVGISGQAGYSDIQSAIDAATAAAGENVIWVQPGSYTEDLSITSSITFMSIDGVATITGEHTPPSSGNVTFDGFVLTNTDFILNSNAAGTTTININNSSITITTGFTLNLPNWTGAISMDNCQDSSTINGAVNNATGLSDIKLMNSEIGAGVGKIMDINSNGGDLKFESCNVNCPVKMGGSGNISMQNGVKFAATVTINGSLNGFAIDTNFRTDTFQAITYNSSGNFFFSNGEVNTAFSPAIGGTGAGNLNLTSIAFTNDITIASTVTIGGGTNSSEGFKTLNSSTAMSIVGNNMATEGTSPNVGINFSTQGLGDFNFSNGNISILTPGRQYELMGGTDTDFIGDQTLIAGSTGVIAHTGIAAADKVFVTREGVNASTALGILNVLVVPTVGFTISSRDQTSPNTIETGDVSTINYFIVREL